MRNPLDVATREDFAAFVTDLLLDLRDNPGEWENSTLVSYLGALSAFAGDLHGWCKNREPGIDPETAQWRLFAVALTGAKVYE